MGQIIDLYELKKTEETLKYSLEYFDEAPKDEFTGEILEQISGGLILLEMIRDKSNNIEYDDRVVLSEQLFELRDNLVTTIKAEGGTL